MTASGGVAAEVTGDGVTDEELIARFSLATIDRDNQAFYRGWLDRRLLMQRCADCGHWHHPPRPLCPECWSFDVRPTPVAGEGVVHLLIRLHQGPAAAGVDYSQGPYPVVTVELAEQEGLRFTSTVVGCPPADIAIGMAVTLDWIERDRSPFPVFRPLAGDLGEGR